MFVRRQPNLLTLLAALIAGFCLAGEGSAQTPKKNAADQKKAAQQAANATSSDLMTEAYVLLATANQDYNGHRLKAMTEVEGACKLLDAGLLTQSTVQQKIKALQSENAVGMLKILARASGVNVNQALSDAQLRSAGAIIHEVTTALVASKQTKILKHTEKATKELETALQGGTQIAQGEMMQTAYILLAAANQDYNGHRAKAMTEVEHASKSLDADLLTQAAVLDRIKLLRDFNAAALAKIQDKTSKPIREVQPLSDTQLYLAGVLIRGAALLMAENKQTANLLHAETALTEIKTALKGR